MFVAGEFPEFVEQENRRPADSDGRGIRRHDQRPHFFPREDIDVWTIRLPAGQTLTCEVCAAPIGSPLDSRLEVCSPDGWLIAENVDALGTDSRLQFTAHADGPYAVHIREVNFGGLQHYIDRLTITDGPWINVVYPFGGCGGSTRALEVQGAHVPVGGVTVSLPVDAHGASVHRFEIDGRTSNPVHLAVDDLPEYGEDDVVDDAVLSVPAVCNGRIAGEGEIDCWKFAARQGESYRLEVHAARLGSPADSVLSVFGPDGNLIATTDDIAAGQTDLRLELVITAHGTYTVQLADRLVSRGGPEHAYRVRITPGGKNDSEPAFRVEFPSDVVNLERGGEQKVKVDVRRNNGFQEAVELVWENLPADVSLQNVSISEGRQNTQLTLTADGTAAIGVTRLAIKARAVVGSSAPVEKKPLLGGPQEIVRPVFVAGGGGHWGRRRSCWPSPCPRRCGFGANSSRNMRRAVRYMCGTTSSTGAATTGRWKSVWPTCRPGTCKGRAARRSWCRPAYRTSITRSFCPPAGARPHQPHGADNRRHGDRGGRHAAPRVLYVPGAERSDHRARRSESAERDVARGIARRRRRRKSQCAGPHQPRSRAGRPGASAAGRSQAH